jgi:DNA-binding response OmpR family regulator
MAIHAAPIELPLCGGISRITSHGTTNAFAMSGKVDSTPVLNGSVRDVVILCVEEPTRAAIAYWSIGLPARSIVADDGYHADRILRAGDCRLLITDRLLPPWPGLPTFLQLRECHAGLRIAFVEGASRNDVALAKVVGATDVLPRPLKRRDVVNFICGTQRLPANAPL